MERNIIHLDLDAFFVAVECRRDTRLKGKALIVGGSRRRGVVAACSYEARRFGVHSAMPMYQAMALCPHAVVVSGDMERYREASYAVTQIIADQAPLFEKASIDEFYIDASGMDRYFGAFRWAGELRQRIIRETRLPISLALSVNKLVSKVATGEFKPNAEVQIAPGAEKDFFSPLQVEKIPMIGKRTTSFLYDLNVRTVGALRELPVHYLTSALGRHGLSLWKKAQAEDDSPVVPYSEQKSISTECTFDSNTTDAKRIKSILIAMVEKVAFNLREQRKVTACVTVKIRYADFDTLTKQKHIPYTSCDHVLLGVAHDLFSSLYKDLKPLRLVGVRLSHLVHGNYQISLFDDTAESVNLYQSIDQIRHKYGSGKLVRANAMDVNKRIRMELNIFGPKAPRSLLQGGEPTGADLYIGNEEGIGSRARTPDSDRKI